MKKLYTYSSSYFTYKVPYQRIAHIYESEEPVFKGCCFEVSTHTGGLDVEWEFKPFKSIEEAQIYALQFLSPASIIVDLKTK